MLQFHHHWCISHFESGIPKYLWKMAENVFIPYVTIWQKFLSTNWTCFFDISQQENYGLVHENRNVQCMQSLVIFVWVGHYNLQYFFSQSIILQNYKFQKCLNRSEILHCHMNFVHTHWDIETMTFQIKKYLRNLQVRIIRISSNIRLIHVYIYINKTLCLH